MKNIALYLIIFSLFNFFSCTAQGKSDSLITTKEQEHDSNVRFLDIDSSEGVISFGKIAKIGKISIFVISTDWCIPCKHLKKKLEHEPPLKKDLDIYFVNLSSGKDYDELKKSKSYAMWRFFERIEEWPTVLIYSPTGNLIKKFNASSLKKENFEGSIMDKIVQVLNRLEKYVEDYFHSDKIIVKDPNDCEPPEK